VIEGMAYGRAVVATPVGAVEDIIEDGETGLLTPVADVAALTAALRRLISDPELRRHLGAAAAASHQRRLNIDVYVERLAEVWRRAARERA
jgi:glycosyltransferase involved in cell wall biosynthesis